MKSINSGTPKIPAGFRRDIRNLIERFILYGHYFFPYNNDNISRYQTWPRIQYGNDFFKLF